MIDDPAVDGRKRSVLRSVLGDHRAKEALSNRISRWVSGRVRVEVPGVVGVEVEAARQFMDAGKRIKDRADILHDYIAPELERTSLRYYLVFDELDEDYRSSTDQTYTALLVGLFRAVCAIRERPREHHLHNVFPIVLLRDDIFGLLEDNDRHKWHSYMLRLEWSEAMLKRLLAYRLSQAAGVSPMSFEEIWPHLVGPTTYRKKEKFDFIESYTLGRPRDFIYYLAEASRRIRADFESGRSKQMKMFGEVLASCTQDFAEHLRLELEDEIRGQLPQIHDIMDILLNSIGKPHFKVAEFRKHYDVAARKRNWTQTSADVLDTLYLFSVIGNVKTFQKSTREYFRYLDPTTEFDSNYPAIIHKGLLAARRSI